MLVKKYIVKNMSEAMTRIRYDLGNEAIIISQRKIRKPGFKGLFSKKIFEVTAAVDNNKPQKENKDQAVRQSIDAIKNLMNKEGSNSKTYDAATIVEKEIVPVKERLSSNESLILEEMKSMKTLIGKMAENSPLNKIQKSDEIINLEYNDVDEETINNLIKYNDINIENIEKEELIKALTSYVSISADFKGRVIVLVGPTGVGKTTTLAKLAGKLALIEKKKVGLITIDTYRIGAVEQLKTYSEIMNIPFKVVFSIKEMDEVIESMSDFDYILVDTTGRSSKNRMQISELRAYLDKINSQDIYLVMSGCTKNKDIETIVEGYSELKFNSVIITKLDETSTYGGILNILDKTKKPIRFVTTGQSVPDDIKVPTKKELVNLILGEEKIC